MIEVLMERDMPPGFDAGDEAQAGRHARIALDAVTATAGKMHWLCTYATDDRKLFGLVWVESEDVHGAWADGTSWHKVIDALETGGAKGGGSDPADQRFGRRSRAGSLPGKDRGADRDRARPRRRIAARGR
jgi:hypothetical protein